MEEQLPQKFIPVRYNELKQYDNFFMSEMDGVYKYTFLKWRQTSWWIVVEAIDNKTGLETEIKINPQVESPLYKSSFNSDWSLKEWN